MFEIRYWMIDREGTQVEEVMQSEIEYERKYYNGITVRSSQSDEGVLIVNGMSENAIHIIRAPQLGLDDPMSLIGQVAIA